MEDLTFKLSCTVIFCVFLGSLRVSSLEQEACGRRPGVGPVVHSNWAWSHLHGVSVSPTQPQVQVPSLSRAKSQGVPSAGRRGHRDEIPWSRGPHLPLWGPPGLAKAGFWCHSILVCPQRDQKYGKRLHGAQHTGSPQPVWVLAGPPWARGRQVPMCSMDGDGHRGPWRCRDHAQVPQTVSSQD